MQMRMKKVVFENRYLAGIRGGVRQGRVVVH